MKESVYSVALNADGTRVASGSPDGFVRISDPRAGEKVMKLRGHTANIRCGGTVTPPGCCHRCPSIHTMCSACVLRSKFGS